MRGLDYKWIEALQSVVALGNFERAAEHLHLSQSAVSQRIKQLEKFLAQPVLVREQPPRPTQAGKKLLGLYHRIQLLENEVIPELTNEEAHRPLPISIATNADSLATWLLPSLTPVLSERNIALRLAVLNEVRAIEKLKSGEVTGAISLESTPISGCQADYLGRVDYVCVASPAFIKRYFSQGVNKASLLNAPAVAYDQYDEQHLNFLAQHFDVLPDAITVHQVGSSEAFIKMALAGVAYCLIPHFQIEKQRQEGSLVDVLPGFLSSYCIYWHHWQLESGVLAEITQAIVDYAKNVLSP
ncbi:LysR family transcriptional regulator ArgP [Vibrio ostreicida]|uniref:HTH-type transcriptional regulator ArgP n=1 Tax=Vibrio ostreicida TaxID=526588 RepID=A0ABT8BPY6_9VIBR|nr:LysR family transcriptional regulator ArgP [Vibrio ostreicida]MDN3608988.1 LysR family transcriptional regulator ArgP [Vibrio ostreicida]NPD07888.1 LysR family transcriptional regulator ArgP [Vibrio ostreicida]